MSMRDADHRRLFDDSQSDGRSEPREGRSDRRTPPISSLRPLLGVRMLLSRCVLPREAAILRASLDELSPRRSREYRSETPAPDLASRVRARKQGVPPCTCSLSRRRRGSRSEKICRIGQGPFRATCASLQSTPTQARGRTSSTNSGATARLAGNDGFLGAKFMLKSNTPGPQF